MLRLFVLSIAVALWMLPAVIARPQSSPPADTSAFRNSLVSIDNIPSPTFGKIRAILRDSRGILWFGTTNGLHKYDGYDVRVFDLESNKYSKQRYVSAILQQGDSSLLLATWDGLWTFNLGDERARPFLPSVRLGDGRIAALAEDSHRRLWIGSLGGGLASYDPASGVLRRYTGADGLSDSTILCLAVDHTGRIWIGTLHGLNSYDPSTGRFTQYHSRANDPQSLSFEAVNAVAESRDGSVWVGTRRGLNLLDPWTGTVRRIALAPGVPNEVGAMTYDREGRLWFSLQEAGLFVYENGVVKKFTALTRDARGMEDPYIYAIYADPSSSSDRLLLWIGTRDGGVEKVRIQRNPFGNYTRGRNLPLPGNGAVISMCEDRSGILWVGLWGGGLDALRYRNGEFDLAAHYSNDPRNPRSLPDNTVSSILQDRYGTLWIGTSDGLAVFEPGRHQFTVYRHVEGDSTTLPDSFINKLYEDREGRIWVCTEGGLALLIRGVTPHFRNFLNTPRDASTAPEGNNRVSDVLEDRAGNIWASMYGAGLNKVEEDGRYTRYFYPADSSRIHECWVYMIHESRNGLLWLETIGGLLTFDPSTGSYTPVEPEELQEAHVFGILEDRQGAFWLSTGIGLIRMDAGKGGLHRYDESRGMMFKEFLSDFCRTRRGTVLAGGLDGFVEFNPDSLTGSDPAPEIVITGLSVFGKAVPAGALAGGSIELDHDQNYVSLSFAALDYVDPKRNRYAYRLIGVDPDWVNAGSHNFASYTHLQPGSYTFQVKGCNSDNVWNDRGASIALLIAPPYWETWWFRILAVVAVGAVLVAVYEFRMRRLLHVERLRLRIADDLHDDIGSNLSTIAMVSRAIQHSEELGPATKRKLAEIYDTALTTAEGMKDIVWFIKPQNDTLGDLLLRMKDTASSLLSGLGHDFQTPGEESSVKIGIDFKRNFFLAFKEILTNIAKHAAASDVRIRVTRRDGMLEMIVQDNGRGFDPALAQATRHGNGLKSLQTRAKGLGGECEILSSSGSGTIVRFSAKL